jgi:hypothetical protein
VALDLDDPDDDAGQRREAFDQAVPAQQRGGLGGSGGGQAGGVFEAGDEAHRRSAQGGEIAGALVLRLARTRFLGRFHRGPRCVVMWGSGRDGGGAAAAPPDQLVDHALRVPRPVGTVKR